MGFRARDTDRARAKLSGISLLNSIRISDNMAATYGKD